MKKFVIKISFLVSLLIISGIFPFTAFAQKVGLCEGIKHVSKSLNKPGALKNLKDYGVNNMGFSYSYGDHPFYKNFPYEDKKRGMYHLYMKHETADEAEKSYTKYYKQLKIYYGATVNEEDSELGKISEFNSKGLIIFLYLKRYNSGIEITVTKS